MAKREIIDAAIWPEIAHFADRIIQERAAKGWSQAKLSEVTGLTQAYISSVEQRLANPSAVVQAQIARALEVPLAQLVMPTLPNIR
jgi:transcriptional regulator with XRE-family HTH domain